MHQVTSSRYSALLVSLIVLVTILATVSVAAAQSSVQPLRYNREELVMLAVEGVASHPRRNSQIYRAGARGEITFFPGSGGITYNFRSGDSAVNMAGNHVEPAVSMNHPSGETDPVSPQNRAFNAYCQIGNEVIVLSGAAKGARGWVIGKHGGSERVMADFAPDVIDKLVYDDKFQIRTIGAGMRLLNIAGVKVFNMSPTLMSGLSARGMGVTADGKLRIGVTHRVPARIMGSGLGRDQTFTGDYDINLFDEKIVAEHNLNTIRFGDIVAILNADATQGRIYRTGAITVGVVVHGRSPTAGHGPGVTTLFTSAEGKMDLFDDPGANLKSLLAIP